MMKDSNEQTPTIMRAKPVLTSTLIATAVTLVLQLVTSFGVPLSDEQTNLISALAALVAPWIVWGLAAHRVSANADVVEYLENGHILAGEGSEIETGTLIREQGEDPAEWTPSEGDDAPERGEAGV